jgi:lipid II:glycine glycyltransferase (peptidoglycan interpeptide bridge formation enzyme)
MIREVADSEREAYNGTVSHVMQSYEWGEFRERSGVKVLRLGRFDNNRLIQGMQATFHYLPLGNLTVGYVPKGAALDPGWLSAWQNVGKKEKAVFIKFEPDVLAEKGISTMRKLSQSREFRLQSALKPLFTKYNFLLDLQLSEGELLKRMKSKTRYNIRLAQRKGVMVEERGDDQEAFSTYLDLYFETTKRQGFFGHNRSYHQALWKTLKPHGMAHLLLASWQGEPLVTWMVLRFKNHLYYVYGGSSTKHREVMASNLIGWEAIKLGKQLGCRWFDFWGAARVPNPSPQDPYYGFHRFKAGYGGELVEYLGSFDLILDPTRYRLIHFLDQARWWWLRLRAR